MNKKYYKHLSVKIMLMYLSIVVLVCLTSVLVVKATSESQIARVLKPVLDSKMSSIHSVYEQGGITQVQELIENKSKGFEYILKKNGNIVYSTNASLYEEDKHEISKIGLVSYESNLWYDFIGVSNNLDEGYNLTMLVDIEVLDEQIEIAHKLILFCISILMVGLVLIGSLIFKLRDRLYGINKELSGIVRFSDITNRVERTSDNNEIDELSDNINEVLAHIEQLVDKKQLIANNIAHDLRTPLTRMSNTINKHIDKLEPEAQDEITAQIEKLLEIFDSILRISKIDSNHPLQLEKCDVNCLLTDIFEFYVPLAESKDLDTSIELDKNLYMVCDKGLVGQAVANALDNAIKYTKSGYIKLKGYATTDNIVIQVIDTGIGIPEDKINDVFLPFYRVDKANSDISVGLGLSLVKSIIESHKAEVNIYQNDDEGTVVEYKFKNTRML
tara:strand:+ start:21379 stop:22710 length:1332 start_codon:yes stop_codon:yes gene_type:complete